MNPFQANFRVYYEDTDAGGVVYHANYLNFMARARSEWLRTQPEFFEALRTHKFLTPVKSVEIHYHAPAFLDDELVVMTELTEFKRVSALFFQKIYRYNTDILLCSATIKLACVDAFMKVCPWPQAEKIRASIAKTKKEPS